MIATAVWVESASPALQVAHGTGIRGRGAGCHSGDVQWLQGCRLLIKGAKANPTTLKQNVLAFLSPVATRGGIPGGMHEPIKM